MLSCPCNFLVNGDDPFQYEKMVVHKNFLNSRMHCLFPFVDTLLFIIPSYFLMENCQFSMKSFSYLKVYS